MSYEDYRAKCRQDPEYRRVEKRLKLRLDIADAIFNLRMWWYYLWNERTMPSQGD